MNPQERGPRPGNLLDVRREPNLKGIGTEFDFGGVKELVVTRDNFSLERSRRELKGRVFGVLGYGVQGPAQSKNLRDNDFPVIVGQRESYRKKTDDKQTDWEKAMGDGWEPGKTLFSDLTEVVKRANFIQYLLSDAGQVQQWPNLKPFFKRGDVLQFSHGFGLVYKDQTRIVPPSFVDVTLIAPKGSGRSVREHFEQGRGINSSVAYAQDATGKALDLTLASGMAIGSGFLFPTSFEKEVFSDLTGERGILMGALKGAVDACYSTLREIGFSLEEAVKHTIEITTQTISKIIGEKGADGLIKELPEYLLPGFSQGFIYAYAASSPVFDDLYEKVAAGVETKITLEANSKPDYRDGLDRELKAIRDSEFGRTATEIRNSREKGHTVPSGVENKLDALMAGILVGVMHAQYDTLRSKGHDPSEAFNETVEEATQSLYPLIDRQGIDWMYANCSTTAQRGALDWNGIFRDAFIPRFGNLYYFRDRLELSPPTIDNILSSEMWKAGKTVRSLRPENQKVA